MNLIEKIRNTYRAIRESGERPVWIHVIPEEETVARAQALDTTLPSKSATVVENLMAAGALPIGKTSVCNLAVTKGDGVEPGQRLIAAIQGAQGSAGQTLLFLRPEAA